jgi:hypothetical protein
MKTFGTGLVVLCMLLAPPVVSGMTALGDGDLAAIRAGSGISLDITGTARITVGSVYYQDTDTGNRIEFNNIVWGGSEPGGTFSFATPAGDPVTEDIGTDSAGRTYVNLHDSTQVSPQTFSSDLSFCGQTLGSIKVSDIVRTENNLIIGAHGGLDFQYNEKIDIGSAKYTYNTTSSDNALTFNGIHLSGTASGDPEGNPNTWTYSGPFKIGDIAGANPAQIDIGTNSSGTTVLQYELPMTGSIRVEDVIFGTDAGNPKHFGPMVLDNLNVQMLAIRINPNP